MAITLVGHTSANTGFNSSPLVISYTSSSASNLLVLLFGISDDNGDWSGSPFTSVTDSAGNTWHFSTAQGSANPPFDWRNSAVAGVGIGAGIAWTFQNVGTVISVTFHENAGQTTSYDLFYSLTEWSGVGSVDSANVNHGSAISQPTGSMTLTNSSDVAVGVNNAAGSAPTAPSGYNQFDGTNGSRTVQGSPGTTGSYTTSWTSTGAAQDFVDAIMAMVPTATNVTVNLTTDNLALASPVPSVSAGASLTLPADNLALAAPSPSLVYSNTVSLTTPNLALAAPAVTPPGAGGAYPFDAKLLDARWAASIGPSARWPVFLLDARWKTRMYPPA